MIVRTGEEVPEIKAFLERKLGMTISNPARVFGFTSDDGQRPLCAVAFNNYSGASIEMTIIAEPGGITRGVLRYLAHYVFVTSGCRRLTVRTKKRNKPAQKMAVRFGFTYESVAKHDFRDDDAVVFRMLKAECRFL